MFVVYTVLPTAKYDIYLKFFAVSHVSTNPGNMIFKIFSRRN